MGPEVLFLSETTDVPSGAKKVSRDETAKVSRETAEVSREAAEEVSSMVGKVSRLVIPRVVSWEEVDDDVSIGDGQESNLDREEREDESSIDEEVETLASRKGEKRGERDEPLMMIPRENNPVRRKEVGKELEKEKVRDDR